MTLTTLLKVESRKWLFELFLQFSKERLTATVYIDVVDRAVKALWPSYVGRMRCEFEVSNSVEKKSLKTIEVVSKGMFMVSAKAYSYFCFVCCLVV